MMELPRTYIIERIKARMASIVREGVDDAAAIAAGDARERELVLMWLRDLAQDAHALAERATRQADELRATDVATSDLLDRARSVKTEHVRPPQVDGWGRSTTDEDTELFNRRRTARERLPRGVKEAVALDHALAYLEGTPVDTFTKTDLRDLGLLDVVKFRL